jgi:3-oxoacyl-[acyl-carrier protein] reductase
MLLSDKKAVITGSNRGIGKKILEVFAENGATIYACSRKKDKSFISFCETLQNKNQKIIPIELDLSNSSSIDFASKVISEDLGKIDILVNNAGIIENNLFQMSTIENIRNIFKINFFGTLEFTQKMIKPMIKNKNGSIIYISSTSAFDNTIGRTAYSASKSALISHSVTLSKELGRNNIRVNSIAPGLTDTDMMRNFTADKYIEEVSKNVSLKRIGKPLDVANVALFLASDLSSYITGQTIRVDGGM